MKQNKETLIYGNPLPLNMTQQTAEQLMVEFTNKLKEAGLLAYTQGSFKDAGFLMIHRDENAKSIHGGKWVLTVKKNRNIDNV